jgi:hypothetical protein
MARWATTSPTRPCGAFLRCPWPLAATAATTHNACLRMCVAYRCACVNARSQVYVRLASVCVCVLTTASTQVGVCNLAGEHADNQHGNLLHFGMPLGLRWICTRRRQVRVRERRPTCLNSFPSVLRLSRTGLCPADSAWKGVGGGGGFRKDAQTHQDSAAEGGGGGGWVGKEGGGNVKELAMQRSAQTISTERQVVWNNAAPQRRYWGM